MDEFDKIREFSEDLNKRQEPVFSDEELSEEADLDADPDDVGGDDDDANLYAFKPSAEDKFSGAALDEIEDKDFAAMKMHVIILSIVAVVIAVVLVGFFVFKKSETTSEVVVVSATQKPVKVRPAEAGGMNIPDKDKLVYDRLRSNKVDTKVESLFPAPEKPVAPKIIFPGTESDEKFVPMSETVGSDPLAGNAAAVAPKAPIKPVTRDLEPIEPVAPVAAPVAAEAPKVAVSKPVTKPAAKVAKTTVAAAPVAAPAKGVWSAQLMSSNKKESVEKAWPTILSKNKALLSNTSYAIVKAEIPGKGTFYRLRVGNFQTREQADALCRKLKAAKQDCVPAK